MRAKLPGFLHLLLVLVLLRPVFASDPLCLEPGIAEENRTFIEDDQGRGIPIGLLIYLRTSSKVLTRIAGILISEKLGFHIDYMYQKEHSREGAYWLSCADVNTSAVGAEQCVPGENRAHVALDTGFGPTPYEVGFLQPQRLLQDCCQRSPRDLGSMGFQSRENMYMKRSELEAALADGFILNLYSSYNTTHHDPRKYFEGLDSLNISDFEACNRTFSWTLSSEDLEGYVNWTGDFDGVTQAADGTYWLRCPDGYFWLAPACRHSVSSCIPTVTFGGELFLEMMHWSTAHGLPLALGSYIDPYIFFETMKNASTLFYWWEPENYRFDVDMVPLMLPVYNASEWSEGIRRTAQPPGYVGKLVSANLQDKAPQVHTLIERFAIDIQDLEELNEILAKARVSPNDPPGAKSSEIFRAACAWISSSESLWKTWIPTACDSGSGLADAGGDFLLARGDDAVGCSVCPSGRFSEPLLDSEGFTYRCSWCRPGTYQDLANQGSCKLCAVGRTAGTQGATVCSLCPLGTFSTQTASTACGGCGNGEGWTTKELVGTGEEASNGTRWIEVRGATSEDFCACVEGRFLDQGRCETCQEGARCLGHTGLTLNPGYFAFPENPGHVYRCFGNGRRCPGGLPGSCAPGRRNSSLTCAECFPGLHDNYDGACVTCNSLDGVILAVLACLLVLGPCAVHTFTLMTQLRSRLGLLEVTLSLGQMVTSAQVLVIIQQGIEWGEPFIRLLESLQFVSMDFLWRILESVNCLTNFTPELRYFTQSLLLPTIFMLVPALTHLVYVRRCRQGKTRKYHLLRKTLGTLSVLFFIPALSSLLAPFRCDVHPNDVQTMQVYQTVSCDFTGSHLRMCLMGGMVSLVLLAFMVLVFWLVYVELPRRLEVFDVDFLRSCSFLWARFRPGAEAFAGAFLVRNALIVVSPLLPSSFASLFFIKVLLYTSFCAVAFFKPLRTMAALYLELVIHAAFLVILDMGMLFMPTEESALVMVACVLISSSVVLIILSMVAHALFLKCRSKYRKQFQFFISHQKSAAGSLARLFKIELSKCGFRSFIDCDDLTDLTRLFLYVSQDVETLVVLGSGNFLTRKWCVGEIVTARLHNVTTLLVALPDFTMPDERFVALYDSMVPNIKELAAYGIGMPEIHETLLWLQCLERFDLKSFDSDPIPGAISWLTGGATKWTRKGSDLPMMRVVSNLSECLILCDAANMEAMAAAQVLFALLGAKMIGLSLKKTLRVLRTGDIVDSEDVHALLLCTEGCLESRQMASWLLQLSFCSSFVLPVLAEDSFQIPFGHELNDEFNEDQDGFDRARYAQVLETIFHETSVPFTPRSSNARQLDLQAKLIAERLQQPVAVQAWRSVSLDSFAGFPDSPGSALASFGFPRVELSEWPTSPTSPASLASPASPTPNVSSNAEDAVLEL